MLAGKNEIITAENKSEQIVHPMSIGRARIAS